VKSPSTYRPKSLPYGKYLAGEDLQFDLISIFNGFGAMADKLVKMGSTQNNESFNNTVASKNPKSHFYSGSESTSFRVAAAVAQKNIGLQTLPKVCVHLMISCGCVKSFISMLHLYCNKLFCHCPSFLNFFELEKCVKFYSDRELFIYAHHKLQKIKAQSITAICYN
jgi:hypothetical protein